MAVIEEIEVWRRAKQLCIDVYKIFATCRDFGFRDQITRAALSLPSNIAEGAERDYDREFARFLRIAKGSAGELRTQLYIALELGYIADSDGDRLIHEVLQISRMLRGLAKACDPREES